MSVFERAIDAIYRTPIATNATIEGVATVVRVIDKSDGRDTLTGPRTASRSKVTTIEPAVVLLDKHVVALGLTIKGLIGKSITFNGKTWFIKATEPRPRPDGVAESYLYIRGTR